jgi:acyl-CoA thioester hydrolase
MGVVYYGNYASYFEVGRVELLRQIGMTYAEMEKEGTMLPVVHMSIDFKRGAKYDEEIFLETKLTELPYEEDIILPPPCEMGQAIHWLPVK